MSLHQGAANAVALKLAAASSGVAALLSWDASTALVGVPVNVLMAALTGALLGVAYGAPIPGRFRLLVVAIVNGFLAAAFSTLLTHAPLIGPYLDKAPAAALALLLGFSARWLVPAVVENRAVLWPIFVAWLRRKLGLPEKEAS
jgi:hypothetical protein